MKCQFCKEEKASIYIQELCKGETYDIAICNKCALEHNIIENYLNLKYSDRLQAVVKKEKKVRVEDNIECNFCGYHINDYYDTLSLSCPNCYNEFRNAIKKTVKNIHSKNKYKPDFSKEYIKTIEKQKKIKKLECRLNELVRDEEYEKAAHIRDRIDREKKHILGKVEI